VKQAIFAYVNHARIRSWNQPVLSNEGKVSCSRKQREPLIWLSRLTGINRLRVRRTTHCATPPQSFHSEDIELVNKVIINTSR